MSGAFTAACVQMRADVDAYPPYQGGVSHFTMLTEAIGPSKKEQNHAL